MESIFTHEFYLSNKKTTMQRKIDRIISASWVIPIIPENTVLQSHAIAIHDGKIVDILPIAESKTRYTSENKMHYENHVLLPGLINAHTHTPMHLFRGLADDKDLQEWLTDFIWPAEKALIHEDSTYWGSMLAIAEMLRLGTTCFNEHYLFPQATLRAVNETGIRAVLGLQMMDVSTAWAHDASEALEKGLDLYKKANKESSRVSWMWAPHAPYTTSNHTWSTLLETNATLHLPIHVHLHETKQEITDSLNMYGKRPIERLHDLGVLESTSVLAVHMTQCTKSDALLLKETQNHVVHCPESNLKLASGIAPIALMQEYGVNIALGTDGAASNNDVDLLGEARSAALLAKGVAENPMVLPAYEALKMATLNGATALGLADKIGSLEPGKSADIISVDMQAYYLQPIYNVIAALVYSTSALKVQNVWVEGVPLLQNGDLCTIEIQNVLHEAEKYIKRAHPYRG